MAVTPKTAPNIAQPVRFTRKANNANARTPKTKLTMIKRLYFARLIEAKTPAETKKAPPNPITNHGLSGVALRNPTNKAKMPNPEINAPNLSATDIFAGGVKDNE